MEKLILNPRGAIYHLNMRPEELGDTVILVGDQGRVASISPHFDRVVHEGDNREFKWATGFLGDKKVTVLSTGIGADNIDIVMNELEAVANIDFNTHTYKSQKKSLSLIRIGTCGCLQPSVPVGTYCVSSFAVGLDNTIKFYQGSKSFVDTKLSKALKAHSSWEEHLGNPYTSACDEQLLKALFDSDEYLKGITVSAPGFYGPQGRASIIQPYTKEINQRLSSFSFQDLQVLNYEMEAAPIYAFARLLGHKAITVCLVLANRASDQFLPDYKPHMEQLIHKVITGISTSSSL